MCNKLLDSTNCAEHEKTLYCKVCHGRRFDERKEPVYSKASYLKFCSNKIGTGPRASASGRAQALCAWTPGSSSATSNTPREYNHIKISHLKQRLSYVFWPLDYKGIYVGVFVNVRQERKHAAVGSDDRCIDQIYIIGRNLLKANLAAPS